LEPFSGLRITSRTLKALAISSLQKKRRLSSIWAWWALYLDSLWSGITSDG